MQIKYSIVFVSDMSRSVAFYRDVIGVPLRFESPGWTEFETGDCTLALHEAKDSGSPPESGMAGSCRTGFRVKDLDAFHQRMRDAGVPCIQEPTETYGVHIAEYTDPDGLLFSVSGGG